MNDIPTCPTCGASCVRYVRYRHNAEHDHEFIWFDCPHRWERLPGLGEWTEPAEAPSMLDPAEEAT